jgi:C1A family cysteine protease
LGLLTLTLLGLGAFFAMSGNDSLTQRGDWSIQKNDVAAFKDWKAKFGKQYTSMEEEMFRMKIFLATKAFVEAENARDTRVQHAINQFSDLTKEEFVATYLGYVNTTVDEEAEVALLNLEDLPAQVNWTQAGDVSAIQNQGQCGSCWSFSAAEAVESAYAVFKGETGLVLSEEQLVQCASALNGYLNFGCNGGQMTEAFRYIKSNPLNTGDAYPYTSGTTKVAGPCNKAQAALGTYGITGYKTVSAGINNLEAALVQQPISVAVDATNWSTYSSGVFSNCGTALNHGVLAVGYNEGQYWIVKNSWGTSWGQEGYIWVDWTSNCGIANQPAFPTV